MTDACEELYIYIDIYIYKIFSQASKVCRCFLHITIYQTQTKIRHILKTTYISTDLSVFFRVLSSFVFDIYIKIYI